MHGSTKQIWLELCEQAANEQDPKKFLALITEINRLLTEKEAWITNPPKSFIRPNSWRQSRVNWRGFRFQLWE